MVARFTLCDAGKLQLALAGELPETALGELSRHLQSCPHCREELDAMSGGERWASDARQYLSSSDELVAVQEMTPPAGVSPFLAPDFSANHSPASIPPENEESAIDLDFLSPSDDPTKLGRLGAYEIESIIGRGGFGIVLKAFDPALNRFVAIKALSGTLVRSSAARKRFDREAKAAAAVVHDHVIPIHHIDTSGPAPFLVMPFITGRSLQERIDACGPLETKEVLRIAMQTAQGLAAAHAQGLVHRDIKPANILLENGVERVRITDFGLARAVDDASQTQSGFIAGTPQYMAPEQARGEPIDARADLFSLGSVMYAMCTGHPPFRAETTLAVLRRICDDEPRGLCEINPDVPAWQAAIVAKLLAKNAAERFQSAQEVANLLGRWLAHLQQPTAIPPPAIAIARSSPARRGGALSLRKLAASGAALVAGMVLLGGLYAWLPQLLFEKAPATAGSKRSESTHPRTVVAGRTSEVGEKKTNDGVVTRSLPVPAIAPVDADPMNALSIDNALVEVLRNVQALEAAAQPTMSEGSIPRELNEVRAILDRLEYELQSETLYADDQGSSSDLRPSSSNP
jgi:eukaryotic-like serine/threonine-protein kinase